MVCVKLPLANLIVRIIIQIVILNIKFTLNFVGAEKECLNKSPTLKVMASNADDFAWSPACDLVY